MLLKTEAVTKEFGGVTAVDKVTLNIDEGELAAIIGPNGAGKTTFFNLIAGKFPPDEGRILFRGEDITRLPAHKRVDKGIAKTFQIPSVFQNLTVFENVRVSAQARSITGPRYLLSTMGRDAETNEVAETLLKRVGLLEFRDRKVAGLPHGHKKRLEIGMALSLQPRLLLLDEVTAGLTAEETREMTEFIRELSRTNTIIIVEHKLDVVLGLSKRICVMHQGRLIADGSPEEIQENSTVQEVYLRGR